MNVPIQVKLSTEIEPWLCFKHAVKRAMKGENIKVELDDYLSDYYMGPTYCSDCDKETIKDTII